MEKANESKLNETQTRVCAVAYNEHSERHGRLPKTFLEFKKDFETLYADILEGQYSSFEIRILFQTYLFDFLPEKTPKAAPLLCQEGLGVVEKTKNHPLILSLKGGEQTPLLAEEGLGVVRKETDAQRLRSEGKSFVQIGKILGVSDKTAKKLVETI